VGPRAVRAADARGPDVRTHHRRHGEITPDGTVYPIGGIQDKVIAAQRAGATIFLAPTKNMEELAGVDTGDMQVIPVATFDDALQALRQGLPTS
jgi:PDZ domain-containing protein